MAKKLVVKNSVEINAPISKVWDALVNPEQTSKYMFGCATVSDWKIGSSLLWQAHYEGKLTTFVSGFVLEFKENKLLKYSVIDPNAKYDHTPENHLIVTYRLSEKNGITTFSVAQDGFETAEDGKKRYKDVYNNGEGWNPILVQIKNILES